MKINVFGSTGTIGKKTLKVNSWASMFSLQALYWLENFSSIDLNDEYELLF